MTPSPTSSSSDNLTLCDQPEADDGSSCYREELRSPNIQEVSSITTDMQQSAKRNKGIYIHVWP
jgi:hypothetical protein